MQKSPELARQRRAVRRVERRRERQRERDALIQAMTARGLGPIASLLLTRDDLDSAVRATLSELGASSIVSDLGRGEFEGWRKIEACFLFEDNSGGIEGAVVAHVRPGRPIELHIDGCECRSLRLDNCPSAFCAATFILSEAWRAAGRPCPLVVFAPEKSE